MFKIIQKQLDTNLIRTCLIIALIYCVLFNSAVFIHHFVYYKVTPFKAIIELTKDFICIYIFLFVMFFGIAVHRLTFIICAMLLFITGALASYYLFFFQVAPTKEVVKLFFGTEFTEAFELMSTRLIVWLLFSLAICIYTIKYFKIEHSNLFLTRILCALCLLFTINCIISPPYKVLKKYFPIQYLHNTYVHLSGKNSSKYRSDISNSFIYTDNSSSKIKGVLVIGESARFDHYAINGYERDTTPLLKNIPDLISFNAESCSNLTYSSVPCMLSRHSKEAFNESALETSFLSILTKLNFNTVWIGTQSLSRYVDNVSLGTLYDELSFTMIPGGSALYKLNDHDGVMLPYLKTILSKDDKQFVVVHTSGSHWSYAHRYPREFAKFTPECDITGKNDPSTCGQTSLVNAYDNSILYTDFFLSNLISMLKDEEAFLIYASDHGESLGENGRFGHAGEVTSERTQIPFIVWFSNSFKENHPVLAKNINAHRGQRLSHDNIFHSVLDCLDISSEIIDKNLSLCGGPVNG